MKEELYKLLDWPLSKQVFAFETVSIDSKKYVSWVEQIYVSDIFPHIENRFYPMLKYIGNPKKMINFWEMLSDLRSVMNLLRIKQLSASTATKLYIYGYFQELIQHIDSLAELSMFDVILHLYEIIDTEEPCYHSMLKIIDRTLHNDTAPFYMSSDQKNDLIDTANTYIKNLELKIYEKQGFYHIEVASKE